MKPERITLTSYFGLALCLFLLSFVVGWSSKWTNNLFYGLMVLPGLVFLIKEKGAGLLKQSLAWGWLVLLLWFLVPATIAGEPQFFKHIFYVLMFVMVAGAFTDPQFFRSLAFVRAQFWILTLYIFICAVHSWATGEFAFGSRVALLPARLQNVIYASIWLFCSLALALPVWFRERKLIEGALAVVLSVIAVLFVLQTRTALVGAVFLLGCWVLYGVYQKPRLVGTVLAICLVILGLLFLVVHNEPWYLSLWTRGIHSVSRFSTSWLASGGVVAGRWAVASVSIPISCSMARCRSSIRITFSWPWGFTAARWRWCCLSL